MNYSTEEIRKCVRQEGLKELPLQIQRSIYNFEIVACDIFLANNKGYYYGKLKFHLENETGIHDIDQVFSFTLNYKPGKRLEEFFTQFSSLIELNDTFGLEDFVGERGTCFLEEITSNEKVYYKINITSLEDSNYA